jgi:hypothetical protein
VGQRTSNTGRLAGCIFVLVQGRDAQVGKKGIWKIDKSEWVQNIIIFGFHRIS